MAMYKCTCTHIGLPRTTGLVHETILIYVLLKGGKDKGGTIHPVQYLMSHPVVPRYCSHIYIHMYMYMCIFIGIYIYIYIYVVLCFFSMTNFVVLSLYHSNCGRVKSDVEAWLAQYL